VPITSVSPFTTFKRKVCVPSSFSVPLLYYVFNPFLFNQLQEWTAQLELLQKGIKVIKTEVVKWMLYSLPHSTHNRGVYPIKAMVDRIKKIHFFIELFNYKLTIPNHTFIDFLGNAHFP